MENCALCCEKLMLEVAIRVGEMEPICRGCYSLLALHFSGLALVEEEHSEGEDEGQEEHSEGEDEGQEEHSEEEGDQEEEEEEENYEFANCSDEE